MLALLIALFLVLSVVSMLRGQEIAIIGFIIASGVILIFLFPGMMESVRFGNVEMKIRRNTLHWISCRSASKRITSWDEAVNRNNQTNTIAK